MDQLVEHAHAIYDAAVRSVQADGLLSNDTWHHLAERPLGDYENINVVGMGKAALAMASVVEAELGAHIGSAVVAVGRGHAKTLPPRFELPRRIEYIEAGHPVPDGGSTAAARRVLEIAHASTAEDLLLVLVSGGGSSMCNAFLGDITLEDARRTFDLLLTSGADIYAMNTVRKHMSRIGGGRLVEAAAPAEVLALLVSDVVGDDPSVIASGPAVPDPTTLQDAGNVLRRHDLWDTIPASVRALFAAEGGGEETPKPGHPAFRRAHTHIIGSNLTALRAAVSEAERLGYRVEEVEPGRTGEAREVGKALASALGSLRPGEPRCLLWGGETTVTVRGNGKGGRNTELALSAALGLERAEAPCVLLSGGTDGIDGPTDAAGAWSTPRTVEQGRRKGLQAREFLANNDSYSYFEGVGALLRPGPTHTNVMDVQVGLTR